jgi:2-polyprenyl-6-methoxyphenol hydroxylase-like FAD-dependent oxidoreductase
MSAQTDTHDAIIIGASLAGCTAAILLARAGASVLLIDQRPEPEAYKVVCGHYIQASALPTIERLGLLEPMLAAGAVRSPVRLWWDEKVIGPVDADQLEPSINLPRKKLDPVIRRLAAETHGVELRLGVSLESIDSLSSAGAEVTLKPIGGEAFATKGKLLVGADGRDSTVAKLTSPRTFRTKNGRFNYSAFYAGPPPEGAPAATSWFLGDQWHGAFPTADGITGYYLMPTHDRLPEFKADLEGACLRTIASLPGAPPVDQLELAAPIVGRIELSNQWRNPIGKSVALIGDAAVSVDPLYGVGCGWALQTGEMLADALAPAIKNGRSRTAALRKYRRAVINEIYPHTATMIGYTRGRAPSAAERFVYRRAARNGAVEERLVTLVSRTYAPIGLARPSEVVKLLRA